MENYMTYLWILVIIVSLVVEASTYSLVALWFIPAAALAIVLALFKINVAVQIVAFFIVSLVCILFYVSNFIKYNFVSSKSYNANVKLKEARFIKSVSSNESL